MLVAKQYVVILVLLVTIAGLSFFLFSPSESNLEKVPQDSLSPTPTLSETEKLEQQLSDVESKIRELPELEKDIFTKCMENKEGTTNNIRVCQEATQEQIFTLSQDLTNLKKALVEELDELKK